MADAITSSLLPLTSYLKVWGCSSAGRAPALQAGGHGFDSHHLHQRSKGLRSESETRYIEKLNGLIAQVVRARA